MGRQPVFVGGVWFGRRARFGVPLFSGMRDSMQRAGVGARLSAWIALVAFAAVLWSPVCALRCDLGGSHCSVVQARGMDGCQGRMSSAPVALSRGAPVSRCGYAVPVAAQRSELRPVEDLEWHDSPVPEICSAVASGCRRSAGLRLRQALFDPLAVGLRV